MRLGSWTLLLVCFCFGQRIKAAAPFNDNFANAILITGASNTVTGSNIDATKEQGEPNHYGNPGGRSVWWTWVAPRSGPVAIDTIGSTFDTILGVYTGNAVSALAYVAANDDWGGDLPSRVIFEAAADTPYRIAVDGYNGAIGNVVVHIISPGNDIFVDAVEIGGFRTSVIGHNIGASKESGEPNHAGNSGGRSGWWTWTAPSNVTVTLDTIGSSFDTLLAVYRGNSIQSLTPVVADDQSGGHDSSRLFFSALSGITYRIAVDGFLGQFGTITLNLQAGQPPGNDAFASRFIISGLTNTLTGSNGSATKEPGEPDHSKRFYNNGNVGNFVGRSVWWTWTAPTNTITTVRVDATGSSFDALLAIYTGNSISNLALVYPDYGGSSPTTAASYTFQASANTPYQIAVDGYGAASGTIVLKLSALIPPPPEPPPPAPPNDNFANRFVIASTTNTVVGSNVSATSEQGEPLHAGEPGGKSIWWTWLAPIDGSVKLSVSEGWLFSALLAVYTGNSVSTLVPVASSSYGWPLMFQATAGRTYQIAVDGRYGGMGSVILTLEAGRPPVNDRFADALTITGSSNSVSALNVYASKEPGEPNHANDSGAHSVWWRWTAPADGTLLLDSVGSS